MIGEVRMSQRWEGDKLAYHHADIIHPTEGVIGHVHTNGYSPRWAFQIGKFRNKHISSPRVTLLFDGASWDSAEEAAAEAVQRVDRFLEGGAA